MLNVRVPRSDAVKRLLVLIATSILFGATTPEVFAQTQTQSSAGASSGASSDALQEVVVTAERRAEAVQTVPVTVNVLTGSDLAAQNITNVGDYTSAIPGVSYNVTGFGDRAGLDITIRGISNTRLADQTAGTGGLTTGFYIDDVAVDPVDIYLYDINRMEVLKGPQGTLFGQASMGGTIRMVTNQPDSKQFAASVEGDLSDIYHGSTGDAFKGMVNVPLIEDTLALRVVGYNAHDGGWILWQPSSLDPGFSRGPTEGLIPPLGGLDVTARQYDEYPNTTTTTGARVALQWTPLSNLVITPFWMYQTKWNPFTSQIDRDLNEGYVTQSYIAEPRKEQFNDLALTIDYDMPFASLTSVSAQYNRDYRWTQDTTQFCADAFGFATDGGIASTCYINFDFHTKVWSQELRLASHTSHLLDWLVGAAYFREVRDNNVIWLAPDFNANVAPANQLPGDGLVYATSYQYTYRDVSEFANVTLKLLNEQLQLSAGVRHFDQYWFQDPPASTGPLVGAIDTVLTGSVQSGDESGVIPRFSAKYSLTPDEMVYASGGKGFRGGGPGSGPALTQTAGCLDAFKQLGIEPGQPFNSDHTWSYELGWKSTFDDSKYLLNLAAFYTKWTDIQSSLILNAFVASCGDVITVNGGEATSKGGEVNFEARPVSHLTLSAALTYTDARLGQQPAGSAAGQEGWYLQNAPVWQGTGSAQYEFPVLKDKTGYFRVDFSYYGWQYSNQATQNNPFFYVPARSLLNLHLGVRPLEGHWEGEIYVYNLADRMQQYGAQQLFGTTTVNQTLVGPPLTLGVIGRYRW